MVSFTLPVLFIQVFVFVAFSNCCLAQTTTSPRHSDRYLSEEFTMELANNVPLAVSPVQSADKKQQRVNTLDQFTTPSPVNPP
jgi:hypothetical protein